MMTKEPIRDFYGMIIGYIETDKDGNQIGRDFYNRILGYYEAKQNITRDFYKRIIGKGNLLSGLIYAEEEKNKSKKR